MITKTKLREHQKYAVIKMKKYFDDYNNNKTEGSGLVHMPTGTGKTGIIAALAQCFPNEIKTSLIVSPRVAICEQLTREISGKFFEDSKSDISINDLKKVIHIEGGNRDKNIQKIKENLASQDGRVLICTIQMLVEMSSIFNEFLDKISILMIDEGHYEPAQVWSEAIRKINKPRILFSATPYRNDFKNFDFKTENVYTLSFKKALESEYIRKVSIEERKTISNNPKLFVQDVLDFYKKLNIIDEKPCPRIIIRCENFSSIQEIAKEVRRNGYNCVAIHERFTPQFLNKHKLNYEALKKVPIDKNENAYNAPIWIHQYKLIEGIDIPEFIILAIYENLKNGRQVVQQIGRIIRNKKEEHIKQETAYVLDHSDGLHNRYWELFTSYDEIVSLKGREEFLSGNLGSLSEQLYNILQNNLVNTDYVYKNFRRKFEFETEKIQFDKEILLNQSVYLFSINKDYSYNLLCTSIENKFLEEDKIYKLYRFNDSKKLVSSNNILADIDEEENNVIYDNSCFLYIYFTHNNPLFLKDSYFYELKAGVLLIKVYPKLIAVHGLGNMSIDFKNEVGLNNTYDPEALRAIFDDKLTKLSLINTNIGNKVTRALSFRAASIEDTVPNLGDFTQIPTSAIGYIKTVDKKELETLSRGRFDINFNTGRISQDGQRLNINEYLEWVGWIQKRINRNSNAMEIFSRYAQRVSAPKNTQAKSILIDIWDIMSEYYVNKSFRKTLIESNYEIDSQQVALKDELLNFDPKIKEYLFFNDSCVEVIEEIHEDKTKTYSFELFANFVKIKIEVIYNIETKKFDLLSEDLKLLYKRQDNKKTTVLGYLNNTQSFRIVTSDNNKVYSQKEFYAPLIGFKDLTPHKIKNNAYFKKLFEILIPTESLSKTKSEKGDIAINNSWPDESLFGIISEFGKNDETLRGFFNDSKILICDDGSNEIADFILVKSDTIIFIHAKHSAEWHPYSASALHEVCSQAVKNLEYLNIYSDVNPPNIDNWDKGLWNGKKFGGVPRKVYHSDEKTYKSKTAKKIFLEHIRNPNINREVWLFLGNMLSIKRVKKEFLREKEGKINPDSAVIQLSFLVHATMADIGSVGAKFKIFCAE